MKKSKAVAIFALILLLSVLVLCKINYNKNVNNVNNEGNSVNADNVKITMITDVGGINDESFNQSAWEGLKKAKKEFGADISYIESKQESDYAQNLETAVDMENDLIISVGFALSDATLSIAKAYPEQEFAIIDVNYGEDTPQNVSCITFDEEMSGEIVGMVAGLTTKTNNIAFIGGFKDNPAVYKFGQGFIKGAEKVNKDVVIHEQYANSFVDSAKGYAMASQLIKVNNADIIFTCAGGTNIGVIERATELNKYVIGVDSDMGHIAPNTVLTSALKNVNVATYTLTKEIFDGNYKPTLKEFNLYNNGIGYSKTNNLIKKDVIEKVDCYIKDITKK